jgi:hypothetical protein
MPATPDLTALLIDPASREISEIKLPRTDITAALTKTIGRRPRFAWIGFPGQALAYSDENGGAPAFFTLNGSPPLRRKGVALDFRGGQFCDTSMMTGELAVLVEWGGEVAQKATKAPLKPSAARGRPKSQPSRSDCP